MATRSTDLQQLGLQPTVALESKRGLERKEISDAQLLEDDEYHIIQEEAVRYIPKDERPSSTRQFVNSISSFTSGTFSTITSWIGNRGFNYGMKLIFTDAGIRNDVTEVFHLMKSNPAADVTGRVQAIVDKIPQPMLNTMIEKAVPHIVLPAVGHVFGKAVEQVPVIGGALSYSKMITAVLLPEVAVAERRLKEMAKHNFAQSEYNKHMVEFLRQNIKPALSVVLKTTMAAVQMSLEPVVITQHSLLDNTEEFQIGANTAIKDREAIIREYHRALATKEFATIMGENVIDAIGFLKQIKIFKYDTEGLAKGLAGDVATAIIPRVVADNVAQRILTNNFTAVNANEKIANAKALAKKLGFELPEPSLADLTATVKAISAEPNNGMLELYRLRNQAAKYAVSKVAGTVKSIAVNSVKTVANSLSSKFSAVSKAFSSVRRTFSSSDDNSGNSNEMPSVAKKWFGDNDFSKLTRIREIYAAQVKALNKLENDVMEYHEAISGVRNDIKVNAEQLQTLRAQFESLSLARTKGVVAGIQVDNKSRLLPILEAGDKFMTKLSDSISNMFLDIDHKQNPSAAAVEASQVDERSFAWLHT